MNKQVFLGILLIVFILGFISTWRLPVSTWGSSHFVYETTVAKRHLTSSLHADDYDSYSEKIHTLLRESSEENLYTTQCTSEFVRTVDGHYLFFNHEKYRYNLFVKDETLLAQIRRVESGLKAPKKFVGGRLCTIESGDVFLIYLVGEQQYKKDDFSYMGTNLETYVVSLGESPLDRPLRLSDATFGPYYTCNSLMQVTKSPYRLYAHCEQVEDGRAKNWFYMIDVEQHTSTLVDECSYPISSAGKKQCQSVDQGK